MDFLIVDLLSEDLAVSWLTDHFHPDGLKCPHCGTDVKKVTPTSIGFMQRFATAKGNGLWLSELKNLLSGMTMTMESAKFTTILPKACGQR